MRPISPPSLPYVSPISPPSLPYLCPTSPLGATLREEQLALARHVTRREDARRLHLLGLDEGGAPLRRLLVRARARVRVRVRVRVRARARVRARVRVRVRWLRRRLARLLGGRSRRRRGRRRLPC